MSEQPIPLTDTEREALVEIVQTEPLYGFTRGSFGCAHVLPTNAERIVNAIASEWLAERDRRVRAAALAPIQALADDLRQAVSQESRLRMDLHIVDIYAGRLERTLAAAGVDAAPNETTTTGATHPAHWKRHGHEGTPCPPGGGCYGGADYRAAVPSGHEQEGDHHG